MNARNVAGTVRKCTRCGKPLPVDNRTLSSICRSCSRKTNAEKPQAAVQRRCRRCREPIPMTQTQGICKRCRHQGMITTDPVFVTCANGHRFAVQSRDGAVVKCGLCFNTGEVTFVTVHRAELSGN